MVKHFTVGSLFSGIGGLELGLERTGRFTVVWQVEINDYCQQVLRQRWPHVTRFRDVCTVDKDDLIPVDLLCGGFPCQNLSRSKTTGIVGIDGPESGLWREYFRLICALRPSYVLVENVAALLERGMGQLLSDLAAIGYDAQWAVLPAAAFGAPHLRRRVFLIAYPHQERRDCIFQDDLSGSSSLYPLWQTSDQVVLLQDRLEQLEAMLSQPSVYGTDDGLPSRLERLEALGNAIVPQVAEYVGNCLARWHDIGEQDVRGAF
jgi:DNA (cytosine-5)-methyltransferase 1